MKNAKPQAEKDSSSPRVAHVHFYVEKERTFLRYVKYLSSPMHIMWRHFLAGTFQGLGFVLGSAILLAVIGFFASQILSNIPIFSQFGEAISVWLETTLSSQR